MIEVLELPATVSARPILFPILVCHRRVSGGCGFQAKVLFFFYYFGIKDHQEANFVLVFLVLAKARHKALFFRSQQ